MSKQEMAKLVYEMAKLQKINQVLMNRVERSTDLQGGAFSLFQAATVLEGQVAQRTAALRTANEDLREAKEVAEQANISKTRFLAAASHDLFQPLNAAKLFAAALAERGVGESMGCGGLVTGITEALESIDGLLRALFEISKLDAGGMGAEIVDVPLGPLFARFHREYQPQVSGAGLQWQVVETSAVVRTDPKLLTRILWNFVSNAIRYTETGRILLGCRHHGDLVSIEVWDTGIGIPDEHLQAIFQEFKQVGQPGRGREKGVGLGLAIVDRIADLLDHPLLVRSRLGKGSMFGVMVPMVVRCAESISLPLAVEEPKFKGDLSELRVMVVDDDRQGLSALYELLNSWGCQVTPIKSLAEFGYLMISDMDPPEIVVADFHLDEGTTGVQVIDRVRTHYGQAIPAFIVTSDRTPQVKAEIKDRGLTMLEKPIQPAKLRALMTHLIKRPIQPVQHMPDVRAFHSGPAPKPQSRGG